MQIRHRFALVCVFVLAGFMTLIVAAAPAAAQVAPPCTVPTLTPDVASKLSLYDAVALLTRQGCSGGALIPAADIPRHLDTVNAVAANADKLSAAPRALAARSDWQIHQDTSGLILVAPKMRHICQSVLDTRLPLVNYTGKASEISVVLDNLMQGKQPPPSGTIGVVSAGQVGERIDAIWQQPITLNLTDVTLQDALNETVRQVPGLFWVMREDVLRGGKGGCYLVLDGDGTSVQGTSNLLPHNVTMSMK